MYCTFHKHTLQFKFLAGTSRGVLRHKDSFFIKVSQDYFSKVYGIGESAPLKGLSLDDIDNFEDELRQTCEVLTKSDWYPAHEDEVFEWVNEHISEDLPSVRFGFETALLDLLHGGKRQIVNNNWSVSPYEPLEINGLVWMGDKEWMLEQLKNKLEAGFHCIKMKIGAIDFEKEMQLLAFIRSHYSANEITIRVDANGAFTEKDVYAKMDCLSEYQVHSIEQPVAAGQLPLMADVCVNSPVPVALDEELIGVHGKENKAQLLDAINPQYIILKPTLVGGISSTKEWISEAKSKNIGWWITSALESNVGLNAIAQLTATYPISLPQGLGTGQLYHNNIPSPLSIENGRLLYQPEMDWDFDLLKL